MLNSDLPPRDWVFDLDNTLYCATTNLFAQVGKRIESFVANYLNLPPEEASKVQKQYFRDYGTTLRGLMDRHDIDPTAYLDHVHDIDLSVVAPDDALNEALDTLPGRKIIFTNADIKHAERILARLGISRHFEAIFDIVDCDYVPKPDPAVYRALIARFGLEPTRTVMVEDMACNLKPAAAMGMTTLWVRTDNDWGREGWDEGHVHHITDNLASWLSENTASY